MTKGTKPASVKPKKEGKKGYEIMEIEDVHYDVREGGDNIQLTAFEFNLIEKVIKENSIVQN